VAQIFDHLLGPSRTAPDDDTNEDEPATDHGPMVTDADARCCVLSVPSPLGDVVDRLTILRLKREHATDDDVRARVDALLVALGSAWREADLPRWDELPETRSLSEVNALLWAVEDALREHEARGDFGETFVERARSVYRWNDRRAALKAAIDRRLGSALHEPKLHR
jgi:hypothetical protein